MFVPVRQIDITRFFMIFKKVLGLRLLGFALFMKVLIVAYFEIGVFWKRRILAYGGIGFLDPITLVARAVASLARTGLYRYFLSFGVPR